MSLQQLPALFIEFKELATAYLRQETVERAEELRRLGGFSFGAALAWAFAIILLAVAGIGRSSIPSPTVRIGKRLGICLPCSRSPRSARCSTSSDPNPRRRADDTEHHHS